MTDVADAGQFTEDLLNIILDEIDDIIIIHDPNHTVIWMNRAALKEFGTSLNDSIGEQCYHLFGKNCCCDDCLVDTLVGGSKGHSHRIIPRTGEKFNCISTPLMKEGELKMVVQHLKKG